MEIIAFKAEHGRYIAERRMNNDLMKVRPEYYDNVHDFHGHFLEMQ